ncbi:hypothetical protein AB0I28_00155 [Phytomonospora sp. NPDC050363]|uniref:hypothetical protein n=1 Tax=Phytomonospora sp. NPDC050363 TaxID=3155642 RepID=UPI0033D88A03
MTSTVDRYLEVAVAGVPPKDRADAGRELRDAIEDGVRERLGEELDEDEAVEAVLVEFGDPLLFAARYRGRPLGLISSVRYPAWRILLRLLLVIIVPIIAGVAFVYAVERGASVASIVGAVAGGALEAVVHVSFWTTLIFALVDRIVPAPAKPEVTWSTAYLPQRSSSTRLALGEAILWAATALAAIAAIVVQHVVLNEPPLSPAQWSFWWPAVIAALALQAVLAFVVHRRGWSPALRLTALVLDLAVLVPPLWLLAAGRALNRDAFRDLDLGIATPPADALTAALLVVLSSLLAWRLVTAARSLRHLHPKAES